MKVQELSVGDVFYACYARSKVVVHGPCRLEGLIRLGPHRLLLYRTTRVVDGSISYLPGNMECIKVGSIPDESG